MIVLANKSVGLNIPQKVKRNDTSVNKIRNSTIRKGLLTCSLYAPSLVKHKAEIEILAAENKIDIIAVNETKLESTIDDSMVTLSGFTVLRCDRNRHGGLVAMFIREKIDFKHRTDLQSGSREILCIEVKPKFGKPFLVQAWYRP